MRHLVTSASFSIVLLVPIVLNVDVNSIFSLTF